MMSSISPGLGIRNPRLRKVNKLDQKLFSLKVTELKLVEKSLSTLLGY